MQIDKDKWLRMRAEAEDAEHDGPSFIQVQEAAARAARARDQLVRFKAAGPQGNPRPPIHRAAHAGEQILAGVGARPDDIARAFERSVKELEARDEAAQREKLRLESRMHEASQHRINRQRLINDIRRWASEQGVVLPGDDGGIVGATSVHVPGPPRGALDIFGRPA